MENICQNSNICHPQLSELRSISTYIYAGDIYWKYRNVTECNLRTNYIYKETTDLFRCNFTIPNTRSGMVIVHTNKCSQLLQ